MGVPCSDELSAAVGLVVYIQCRSVSLVVVDRWMWWGLRRGVNSRSVLIMIGVSDEICREYQNTLM
jgi:hypothetical protein